MKTGVPAHKDVASWRTSGAAPPVESTDRRGVARLRLRNGIAKCFCIFADAVVPGDDRHQRRPLAEQLRCRKVNSVERANGFDGPPISAGGNSHVTFRDPIPSHHWRQEERNDQMGTAEMAW
jgi:hypothetical protein